MLNLTGSQIVNDVLTILGVAGAFFGFAKSKTFASFVGFVKKEEPLIVAGVDSLLHSPAAKVVEVKLDHELNVAHDALKNSALGHYAQVVITGVGATYESLSQPVQAALISFVKAHLPKQVVATETEIVDALKAAPQSVAVFKNDPTYQKALELEQLLANAAQPAPVQA